MRRPGIPVRLPDGREYLVEIDVRLPDGREYLVEIDPERIAQQLAAFADASYYGAVQRLGGGLVVRRKVGQ